MQITSSHAHTDDFRPEILRDDKVSMSSESSLFTVIRGVSIYTCSKVSTYRGIATLLGTCKNVLSIMSSPV